MNFILAILLLAIISFSSGIATTQVTIIPGGPAERAGIQDGDIISAIDNKKIGSWDEVVELISKKPNDEIAVKVIRKGEHIIYNVDTSAEPETQRGIIGIKTVVIKHSLSNSLKFGVQKLFGFLI